MTLSEYNVPAEVEKKILTAIELKKELQRYELEIKEELTKAMIANDLYSIKNEKYSVTLVTKPTYGLADGAEISDVPEDFKKIVLDTTKIGKHDKLYGEVPEFIQRSETKFIQWRSK